MVRFGSTNSHWFTVDYKFTQSTSNVSSAHGEWLEKHPGIRGLCYRLSEAAVFQLGICAAICTGVTLLTIRADLEAYEVRHPDNTTVAPKLETIDKFDEYCLVVFIFEIVVRLVGYPGDPWRPWKDAWLRFDLVLVLIGAADTWFLKSSLDNVLLMRLARLFRLARFCSTLRVVASLQTMAKAFQRVFLHAVLIVIALVLLLGSVAAAFTSTIGTMSLEGEPELKKHQVMFTSFSNCMFSLMLILLRTLQWGVVVDPWIDSSKRVTQGVGLLVMLFAVISVMFVLNMVKSITINDFLETRHEEAHSLAEGNKCLKRLHKAFSSADAEEGHLTLDGIEAGIEQEPNLLKDLGINKERVHELFTRIGTGTEGSATVPAESFLMEVLKLSTVAKSSSMDSVSVDFNQKLCEQKLQQVREGIEQDLAGLHEAMKKIEVSFEHLDCRVVQLATQDMWLKGPTERTSRSRGRARTVNLDDLNDRLATLEARADTAEREEAAQQAAAVANGASAALHEALDSEVLPWLRAELASLPAARSRDLLSSPRSPRPDGAADDAAPHALGLELPKSSLSPVSERSPWGKGANKPSRDWLSTFSATLA